MARQNTTGGTGWCGAATWRWATASPRVWTIRTRTAGPTPAGRAARHGARLVDLWSDDDFANPLLWSIDRLHLNPYGHRRVAAHVLTALGIEADPQWWELPVMTSPRSWVSVRAEDVRWVRQHLA